MIKLNVVVYIGMIMFFLGCEKKYTHVSTDSSIVATTEKQKQFIHDWKEYWEAFSNKDFTTSYNYEMPYLRYQHDLDWYKALNRGNRKGFKLELKEYRYLDDNIMLADTKHINEKGSFVSQHEWVYIENRWYHTMITSILPTKPKRYPKK